jgi:F0F1-type ATP synthase assembly protein I
MLLMQSKKKYFRAIAWSLSITIVAYLLFGVLLKATLPVGAILR